MMFEGNGDVEMTGDFFKNENDQDGCDERRGEESSSWNKTSRDDEDDVWSDHRCLELSPLGKEEEEEEGEKRKKRRQ